MPDPQPTPTPHPTPGFPYVTVVATLLTLFVFLGLGLLLYRPVGILGGRAGDQKADPETKLNDVKARNQAVLDGADPTVKMPVDQAAGEVRAAADATKDDAHKHGRLPFPVEPKAPESKDKK